MQAFLNRFPTTSLRIGWPFLVAMIDSLAERAGGQDLGQLGQHRDRDPGAGLLGVDGDDAIADMLPAKSGGVAAAQAGKAEHAPHDALARTQRPAGGVLVKLLLGPFREAFGLGLAQLTCRRSDRMLTCSASTAHLNMPRMVSTKCRAANALRRSMPCWIARGRDPGQRRLTAGRQHLAHDVLALLAGRQRKIGPGSGLPVEHPQPAKGAFVAFAAGCGASPSERGPIGFLKLRRAVDGLYASPAALPKRTYQTVLPWRLVSR